MLNAKPIYLPLFPTWLYTIYTLYFLDDDAYGVVSRVNFPTIIFFAAQSVHGRNGADFAEHASEETDRLGREGRPG